MASDSSPGLILETGDATEQGVATEQGGAGDEPTNSGSPPAEPEPSQPAGDAPSPPAPEAPLETTVNTPAPKGPPATTTPPPKPSSSRPSPNVIPSSPSSDNNSESPPGNSKGNSNAGGTPYMIGPPSRKTPSQQSSPGNSGGSSGSSGRTAIILGAALAGAFVLILLTICLCCCLRKKKRKHHYYMDPPPHPHGAQGEYYNGAPNWSGPQSSVHPMKHPPPPNGGGWTQASNMSGENHSGYSEHQHMMASTATASPNMNFGSNKFNFTYEELAIATDGFCQGNLLGQGGFGYVHKGVFPDGKEVAVKSLKVGSGQGEREFQAEVEIISRVHHRHLVSLVGYCIADNQRMLVYEFVPNNTLEHHLHGKGRPTMDWSSRMRIAMGSAKGLAYLHEDCHPRIIHRDIKAANILLDNNFEAMVADFGLAKLSTDNHTHVSTRVMGTFGYLAPEYASSGKLSEKSDVFSFGVMLLELITGKRPVDPTDKYMEDSLVDWARPLLTRALEEGIYEDLVDPRLENNFSSFEMSRMVACASASVRHSARRRPRMSQIVRALEGDSSLEDLKDGPKPGQVSNPAPETMVYDTCTYNADIMKFRKMVMSPDYASSEFTTTTSEYGHNPSSSSSDSRDLSTPATQRPN